MAWILKRNTWTAKSKTEALMNPRLPTFKTQHPKRTQARTIHWYSSNLAYSQTLYFLFKVLRAWVFIDALASSPMFLKRTKTTSVYRLHWKVHQRPYPCCGLHLSHTRTWGDWWPYCALGQSLLFFGQSYPLAFWLHPFALGTCQHHSNSHAVVIHSRMSLLVWRCVRVGVVIDEGFYAVVEVVEWRHNSSGD